MLSVSVSAQSDAPEVTLNLFILTQIIVYRLHTIYNNVSINCAGVVDDARWFIWVYWPDTSKADQDTNHQFGGGFWSELCHKNGVYHKDQERKVRGKCLDWECRYMFFWSRGLYFICIWIFLFGFKFMDFSHLSSSLNLHGLFVVQVY